MPSEGIFVLLFVVATTVAIAVRRLHVPYTVALVLAGLGLGELRLFPAPELTRELLFSVFLPGLLFEAAFHIEFRDFWRNRRVVFALAVPGVVASTVLTALVLTPVANALAFVSDFTWRDALVFGALISATDPIAVVAIFRSLGAPRRLAVLLDGESLLNDGTAIVFFTLALTLVGGGAVSAGGLALEFVKVVGGGALVGVGVGLAVSQVIRQVDDPMIEITLTTIAAYGSFAGAEQLHVSGVIATVAAGMLCGNYAARTGMSPSTRVSVETFWEYVAYALNSIVFLLIGLEVNLESLAASWLAIAVAYVVVTLGRGFVIGAGSALFSRTRERMPAAWSAVLTWGGLRGGLPMVLALSLPPDFPHRPLLVSMTFGVVLLSIGLQGLTTSPLLRFLGVVRRRAEREAWELGRGRLQAAGAALEELDRMRRTHAAADPVLEELRRSYEERVAATREQLQDLHVERSELASEERLWAQRHLLLVEKDRLLAALRGGLLGQDAYEQLVADADARLLELESGGGEHPGGDE